MRDEEIVTFWKSENLQRWLMVDLQDVVIPDSAKQFLVDVGLPAQASDELRFGLNSARLVSQQNYFISRSYFVVGADCDVPLCLNSRGHVIEAYGPEPFVNSSVKQFSECLIHWVRCRAVRAKLRRKSDRMIPTAVGRLEGAIRRSDSEALRDPDHHWWPGILQQMRDGLM